MRTEAHVAPKTLTALRAPISFALALLMLAAGAAQPFAAARQYAEFVSAIGEKAVHRDAVRPRGINRHAVDPDGSGGHLAAGRAGGVPRVLEALGDLEDAVEGLGRLVRGF